MRCILDKDRVKFEIEANALLTQIKRRIISGNWNKITEAERPFFRVSRALAIEDDLIYKGDRLFIPAS